MTDVKVLKQALPYMRAHRGKTFVVKMGGELVVDPAARESLAQDIALAHHVGIRLTVVHGGGPQATDLAGRLGLKTEMVEGRRVTDEATLEVAKMVFAGKINVEILGALRGEGLRAVGLSGVDGGILQAVRRAPQDVKDPSTGEVRRVDFGHVGDIREVDSRLLTTLMDAGYVPVVASLAADEEGRILNINADTVANAIAVSLKADKLIVLTNVPGVLRNPQDPQSLISCLCVKEAEELIASGVVTKGMVPKLRNLIEAARAGIPRVHVLSGTMEHGLLLELFTREGAGTMITLEDERQRWLTE
jgi:acetylglutamate kinase